MRAVAISAADSKYFHLLQGLVLSLAEQAKGLDLPLVVLDVGLTEAERSWLAQQGVGIKAIEGLKAPPAPGPDGKPKLSAAQRLRPFLPQLVPGYELYLWIDADIWLQSPQVLPLFIRSAAAGGIAIVPEVHVAYRSLYGGAHARGMYGQLATFFDKETAEAMAFNPTINSGFFGLRADQPHWRQWAETLTQLSAKTDFYYSEQIALNHVIYRQGAKARFLPAWCNWICHQALPVLEVKSGQLLDPTPPHAPLGAIHLTVSAKAGEFELLGSDGARHRRTLKYRAGNY